MRVLLLTLTLACAASGQWPTSPLWTPEQLGPGTVTQRFDAAALGLGNGAAVSSWPDSSGNGNTLTPPNLGSCNGSSPTYTTNVLNGLGMVTFSGSNCLTNATNSQTSSVFVVAGGLNGGTNPVIASQDGSASNTIGWMIDQYFYGNANFCSMVSTETGGAASCSALNAQTGSWAGPLTYAYGLLNGHTSGTTSLMYVNGYQAAAKTSTGTRRTQAGMAVGGAYANHTMTNLTPGNIGEVVTTAAITDAQRVQIQNYLSTKWFLAPPQTYEFSAFRQVTTSLILSVMTSSDAATWTDSPGAYWQGSGGNFRNTPVRDPSIALYRGTWWMVHTITGGTSQLAVAKSADRGIWQYVQIVTKTVSTGVFGVAPEIFVDEDGSFHVLSWTDDPTYGCPAGNYCIEETHPVNGDPGSATWSDPVVLATPDDTKVIDPFILKIGSTYYLFAVSKSSGTVEKLFSSSSLSGPYGYVRTLAGTNEGPSVIRMDGKWRLYWDPGSGGLQYSDCAGDPATCTWTAATAAAMPYTALHGTAIRNPGNPAGVAGGIN